MSSYLNWIDNYNLINRKYKKLFVFRIGTSAGFYSEYNNMILAMIYCLKNSIRFKLCDLHANFSKENGLDDFFIPFCEKDNRNYHLRFNNRPYDFKNYEGVKRLIGRLTKKCFNIDFLTQDLWDSFRSSEFENLCIEVPQLGITSMGLTQSSAIFIENIYQFNLKTKAQIDAKISNLKLPERYVGVHIRRGDKELEVDLLDLELYIKTIERYSDNVNIFVLSDDYSVIQELRLLRPSWNVYTTVGIHETGYAYNQFNKQDAIQKRIQLINLFTAMEILYSSEIFIGTFSSNIGMFMGMRRDKKACYSPDGEIWSIR